MKLILKINIISVIILTSFLTSCKKDCNLKIEELKSFEYTHTADDPIVKNFTKEGNKLNYQSKFYSVSGLCELNEKKFESKVDSIIKVNYLNYSTNYDLFDIYFYKNLNFPTEIRKQTGFDFIELNHKKCLMIVNFKNGEKIYHALIDDGEIVYDYKNMRELHEIYE